MARLGSLCLVLLCLVLSHCLVRALRRSWEGPSRMGSSRLPPPPLGASSAGFVPLGRRSDPQAT